MIKPHGTKYRETERDKVRGSEKKGIKSGKGRRKRMLSSWPREEKRRGRGGRFMRRKRSKRRERRRRRRYISSDFSLVCATVAQWLR